MQGFGTPALFFLVLFLSLFLIAAAQNPNTTESPAISSNSSSQKETTLGQLTTTTSKSVANTTAPGVMATNSTTPIPEAVSEEAINTTATIDNVWTGSTVNIFNGSTTDEEWDNATTTAAASWSVCTSTSTGVLTTKCSKTIRQVTEQEMSTYMASYNGQGCCVEFGTTSIQNTNTGYIMTCQCNPGSGDSCYLEFDMDDTTEFQNKINGDGTYDLITSAEIKCDLGGRNVLQSNGKLFSNYACYTYFHLDWQRNETCTKKPAVSNAPTKATTMGTTMLAMQPATTPSNKAPLISQPLLSVILFGLSVSFLIQKHSAENK